MADPFDPYQAWLGISPEEQPPDHYRLLGIPRFERDRVVIETATLQRMASLEAVGVAEHAQARLKLILEIRAARTCLLNENRRRVYNLALEQAEAEKAAPASADLDELKLAPLDDEPVRESRPSRPWQPAAAAEPTAAKTPPQSARESRSASSRLPPPPPVRGPAPAATGSLLDEELSEHFKKLQEEALLQLTAQQRKGWWQFFGRKRGKNAAFWDSPLMLAIAAALLLLLGCVLLWVLMSY